MLLKHCDGAEYETKEWEELLREQWAQPEITHENFEAEAEGLVMAMELRHDWDEEWGQQHQRVFVV